MAPPAKPQFVSWDEQIEAERKRDREGNGEAMAQHLDSYRHWLCCPFCVSVGYWCLTGSRSACRIFILTRIHPQIITGDEKGVLV